jgi:hypothetical protein
MLEPDAGPNLHVRFLEGRRPAMVCAHSTGNGQRRLKDQPD